MREGASAGGEEGRCKTATARVVFHECPYLRIVSIENRFIHIVFLRVIALHPSSFIPHPFLNPSAEG